MHYAARMDHAEAVRVIRELMGYRYYYVQAKEFIREKPIKQIALASIVALSGYLTYHYLNENR